MWLVVLGTGAWGYGGKIYRAGVHEVSDEVAAAAAASGKKTLAISSEQPTVSDGRLPGPLTPDDIRTGRRGVSLAEAQLIETEELDDTLTPPERDYDFSCKQCPWQGPTSGALTRHEEFHH
jgi:hypothetical protein